MAAFTDCTTTFYEIPEASGCSLTRATLTPTTYQQFVDRGYEEYLTPEYARALELPMMGASQACLSDLLRSRVKGIKGETSKVTKGSSVIQPFITRRQRSVVNNNYWAIDAGAAGDAEALAVHPGAWKFTISIGAPGFTRTSDLKDIKRYFQPGMKLFVETISTEGVASRLQYDILSSSDATAGAVQKAYVTVVPNITAEGWSYLDADEKAAYQPDFGLVRIGANDINDFESWCYNAPVENNWTLKTFWLQTQRESMIVSEEYLKALQAPSMNEFYKVFMTLPWAEQQTQMRKYFENARINSAFFGQAINENQTEATWKLLPTVTDVEDATCEYEYKANSIGIMQQLADCGRVSDLGGAALNLDTVRSIALELKRERQTTGFGTGEFRIDALTDRWTLSKVRLAYNAYRKARYGVTDQYNYRPDEALKFRKITGVDVEIFQFEDEGIELAVYAVDYFNDLLDATPSHTTYGKSFGRHFVLVDWSDIEVGVAGTNSAKRVYAGKDMGNYNSLYTCVISTNPKTYDLRSITSTVIVGNPYRHYWFLNFSADCPRITAGTCTVYDAS